MIFHKKKSACLRAQTSSSTHANQFLQFQIFLQNCNHKITYNHKLFFHKINHNHTKESFTNQSQSYIHIYLKKKIRPRSRTPPPAGFWPGRPRRRLLWPEEAPLPGLALPPLPGPGRAAPAGAWPRRAAAPLSSAHPGELQAIRCRRAPWREQLQA